MATMAEAIGIDSKVSSESRVVVPREVREALGIQPGDRVRFVVEGGEVRLVTTQSMLFAVWANNHGGDAGDSVVAVRRHRAADTALSEAKWERVSAAVAAETRSDEQIEADLVASLGLS